MDFCLNVTHFEQKRNDLQRFNFVLNEIRKVKLIAIVFSFSVF